MTILLNDHYLHKLLNKEYDCVDFGCSRGGSILQAKRFWQASSVLGIDIDEEKLTEARKANHEVINVNINNLPDTPELVRFVTMVHFLEHIPNHNDVISYVKKALIFSREFIYIRQPFFDKDVDLMKMGLKFTWSDWRGHPNRMTSLELYNILRTCKKEALLHDFAIFYKDPVYSSDYPRLLPLCAPEETLQYDATKHKIKPVVTFNDVYAEVVAVGIKTPEQKYEDILRKIKMAKQLMV